MVDPQCQVCTPALCVHGEQSPTAEEVALAKAEANAKFAAAYDHLLARSNHPKPAVEVFHRPLTNARHAVDQAHFSISVLRDHAAPQQRAALADIVQLLQRALTDLGNHELDLGLACHVLGGAR